MFLLIILIRNANNSCKKVSFRDYDPNLISKTVQLNYMSVSQSNTLEARSLDSDKDIFLNWESG